MKKKLLAILLAVLMTVMSVPVWAEIDFEVERAEEIRTEDDDLISAAETFSINRAYLAKAVNHLNSLGVIDDTYSTFRASDYVAREEFAVLVFRL